MVDLILMVATFFIVVLVVLYLVKRFGQQFGRRLSLAVAVVISLLLVGPALTVSPRPTLEIPLMIVAILSVPAIEYLVSARDFED